MRVNASRLVRFVAILGLFAATIGCGTEATPPAPFEGVVLQKGVHYATTRVWPTRPGAEPLLRWLSQSERITLSPTPPDAASPCECELTVLVHGYSSREPTIAAYFSGFVDYLREDAGYGGPIIVFDWASEAQHYDPQTHAFMVNHARNPALSWEQGSYIMDGATAQRSTGAFIQFLKVIRMNWRPRRINIIAHSMGGLLVTEAMKERRGFDQVDRVVLLAPDVGSGIVNDPDFRLALASIDELAVYYSAHDEALGYSKLFHKSNRLGLDGPAHPVRGTPSPSNLVSYNATSTLGSSEVHGVYVTRDGARALGIAERLR